MNKEHLENSSMSADSTYDNSKILNEPPNSQKRLSYDNVDKLPSKKAKKSLEDSWDSSDIPFAVETPVRDIFEWERAIHIICSIIMIMIFFTE